MKVLADTNILFSALLYPNGVPGRALIHVAEHHNLYLSDYNISELRDIVNRKIPDKMADVDVLLAHLAHEIIIAPISPEKLINDPKDAPILNAAILADVDVIISGDMHFHELYLNRPEVLSASDYLNQYGQ